MTIKNLMLIKSSEAWRNAPGKMDYKSPGAGQEERLLPLFQSQKVGKQACLELQRSRKMGPASFPLSTLHTGAPN